MFNELIEAIGYDNMLDVVFSDKTIKLDTIYIRVPLDKEIDSNSDVLIIKKTKKGEELEPDVSKLLYWFKNREIYSSLINSNKSIVMGGIYSKKISSNQASCIIFNESNITKSMNNRKLIGSFLYNVDAMINEYVTTCGHEDYYNYFKKAIDILPNYDLSNKSIKIFLDVPLETYKAEYDKYIEENILDATGLTTIFITLNNKKPFLSLVNNPKTTLTHVPSKAEAKNLFILHEYFKIKGKGIVKYGNSFLKYNTVTNSNTKKKNIIEFDIVDTNDVIDVFENDNLLIKDLLHLGYNDICIDSMDSFENSISKLLYDPTVPSNYMYLYTNKAKNFKNLYEHIYSNPTLENLKKFKNNFAQIFRWIYDINKYSDYEFRIKNIFLLEVGFSDYFFNLTNGRDMELMYDKVKFKISSVDDTYLIEDYKEFSFLCGQLGTYLKVQYETSNKTQKLIREYWATTNFSRISDLINRDLNRVGYKLPLYSRFNKLLAAVFLYAETNDTTEVDSNNYRLGLLSNNLLFTKSINKNKKGSNDDEK